MAIAQFNPSTLKLSYNPVTGKVQMVGVDVCAEGTITPLALDLTLSGVDGSECSCCRKGAIGKWRTLTVSGVDGTYRLPQSAFPACKYSKQFAPVNKGTIYAWNQSNCTDLYGSWTINAIAISVTLGAGVATVTVTIGAGCDPPWYSVCDDLCYVLQGEVFTNKGGEDCGVWDLTGFNNDCDYNGAGPFCQETCISGGSCSCARVEP